jgi:hypothetical protein
MEQSKGFDYSILLFIVADNSNLGTYLLVTVVWILRV